ncbi:MAG: tRNA threonylcarbamoyladenosine dehydratase [Chitinophagales bacterium]
MEIPYWMSRTQLMLGEEDVKKLINSNVLVVGLGGVGGICAEMIARTGVSRMTIIDGDVVEASNRNRQIITLASVDGQKKTEVMRQRLLDISPEIQLQVIGEFLEKKSLLNYFMPTNTILWWIALTLTPKVALIHYCYNHKLKFISSMGAGGRLDPSKVQVTDISKTFNCKLAYKVRKRLHQKGVYRGIKAVFSTEQPDYNRVREVASGPKKSVIGTISYLPAIFGCVLASEVIKGLLGIKK